jgi:hypothetical protein
MQINETKLNAAIENAKSKTTDRRWLNAIDKAVVGLKGGWIVTELKDSVLITTESGNTYHANGVCQCKAYQAHTPCKHRAAARLLALMSETEAAPAPSPADEVRTALRAAWNRKYASNRRYNLDHTMASICGRDVESAPLHYLQQLLRALPMAEV